MTEKEYLDKTRTFFDGIAATRRSWKNKNWYYYRQVTDYHRFWVPEGLKVLQIGSGDGRLLADLKPSRGLGIDASPLFVKEASAAFPHLEFREGFAENFRLPGKETFDVIVLSNLVGYLYDVEKAFENLRQACDPHTRVIVHYYNYLWEPFLSLASRLGLRMRQPAQNWLSNRDIENLLHIAGFETVKATKKFLFPFYIPLISAFLNRIVGSLPLIRNLCLCQLLVARPAPLFGPSRPESKDASVSIIVACKDEKGNIEELVRRVPDFGAGQEVIFVDGRSKDGTPEEINRVKDKYPDRNIRFFEQTGPPGKGAAVRQGFEEAKNEVLMILDADLSVAPEDLPKFYRALVSGTGEFINGSRMVYPMEKQAMRHLNVLGNKFFSAAFTYLLDQRIRDTLCGTKVLYKSDYRRIAQNRTYFGDFDPFGDFDLLFGAVKQNLRILEVPVRYYERRYGTTKIDRFRHGLLLLRMCGIALRKLKFY